MAIRAVHWHEGMFLRPHHLQAAQRHNFHFGNTSEKWDHHYNWGLRAINLDRDALANHRFVAHALQARLRDGTLISVPEDGLLPALDLKPAFERDTALTVFLAVPVLHLGRANAAGNGQADDARFLLDTQELEDENTGLNPQPVQVRLLNVRLLLSNQDHAGYEVLPIARIQKSSRAEAAPEIDVTYIPPVLACDAWSVLSADILQTSFDRIGKKVELLATQAVSRGVSIESQAAGDALIIEQLRILNEAYALLGILVFAQGVHPLPAYLELCRLVGQLAIFSKGRRTPELPKYDHDDLGGCFYRIKKYLDALLDVVVEPDYKERPFVGAGLRMQVTIEPSWLESVWQMYVGVRSTLQPDDCIKLLTRGGLDMKIGSSERVDEIYRLGQAGLKFAHSPRPPRALPALSGLVYFQVSRDSQQEEWQNVQRTLTLAIRLKEHLIAGNIEGQRVLAIKTGGQATAKMQFTLYVVKQEK
jgi:type VI secretion system protein ImpJ